MATVTLTARANVITRFTGSALPIVTSRATTLNGTVLNPCNRDPCTGSVTGFATISSLDMTTGFSRSLLTVMTARAITDYIVMIEARPSP